MLVRALRAPLRGAFPVHILAASPPAPFSRAGLHYSALVQEGPRPPAPPKDPPKRTAKWPSKANGKPAPADRSGSGDDMKASPFAGELSSGSDQPESHPVQAEGTSKDIKHRHDKEKKQLKIVGQKPPPLVSRKQKAPKELEGLNTSRLKGLHFGELAPSPEKVQPAKRPAGVPTSSVMRAKMLKERQRQEQMIIEERQKKVKSVVAPIKRVLAVPFKPLTVVWKFLFGKGGGGDHSIRESWNALSAEQRLVVAGGLAIVALIGIWASDYLQATIPPTESEQQDLQDILANIRSRYDQLAENLGAAGNASKDNPESESITSDEVMVDTAPKS